MCERTISFKVCAEYYLRQKQEVKTSDCRDVLPKEQLVYLF